MLPAPYRISAAQAKALREHAEAEHQAADAGHCHDMHELVGLLDFYQALQDSQGGIALRRRVQRDGGNRCQRAEDDGDAGAPRGQIVILCLRSGHAHTLSVNGRTANRVLQSL